MGHQVAGLRLQAGPVAGFEAPTNLIVIEMTMATGFASVAGILKASAIKSRDRNALPTFGSVKRRTSERKIRHLNSIYTLTYMSRLETQGLAFCGRMRSPSPKKSPGSTKDLDSARLCDTDVRFYSYTSDS